jgi:hypothetical protein
MFRKFFPEHTERLANAFQLSPTPHPVIPRIRKLAIRVYVPVIIDGLFIAMGNGNLWGMVTLFVSRIPRESSRRRAYPHKLRTESNWF